MARDLVGDPIKANSMLGRIGTLGAAVLQRASRDLSVDARLLGGPLGVERPSDEELEEAGFSVDPTTGRIKGLGTLPIGLPASLAFSLRKGLIGKQGVRLLPKIVERLPRGSRVRKFFEEQIERGVRNSRKDLSRALKLRVRERELRLRSGEKELLPKEQFPVQGTASRSGENPGNLADDALDDLTTQIFAGPARRQGLEIQTDDLFALARPTAGQPTRATLVPSVRDDIVRLRSAVSPQARKAAEKIAETNPQTIEFLKLRQLVKEHIRTLPGQNVAGGEKVRQAAKATKGRLKPLPDKPVAPTAKPPVKLTGRRRRQGGSVLDDVMRRVSGQSPQDQRAFLEAFGEEETRALLQNMTKEQTRKFLKSINPRVRALFVDPLL